LETIFNIHTHIYPEKISEKATDALGKFYDFPVEGKGTYSDLEADSANYNVAGFLLLAVATNTAQVEKVNAHLAKAVQLSREHGFNTVGFGGIHQDHPDFEGVIANMKELGLRGIKIHPDIQGVDIDDPRLLPLYEMIEGDLPIYLHMGDDRPEYRFSEPKKLARIMDRFPKLEVVAAHLGGYRAWQEAENELVGRDNIWYDTSSALWAMTPDEANHMIDVLGDEHIMFGNDYPVKTLKQEMEYFNALQLSEEKRKAILYDNAARFLKL